MAKQVIYRRGTTAEHANFVGANGEITVDTVKHVVVVHDGVTAGGFPVLTTALLTSSLASLNSNVISHTASITSLNANAVAQATLLNTLSANAAAQQTSINDFILASNATVIFANIAGVRANVEAANVQIGLLYGNATIQSEAIVLANANIIALQSSITAANSAIASFVTGSGFANITQLTANITAVNSAISTQGVTFATNVAVAALRANVTAANSAISSLQAGLTAANVLIDNISLSPALIAEVTQAVTDANVAMQSYVDAVTTSWTANAGTQATDINSLRANITAANLNISAVTTAWTANASTQATDINSLRANITAANTAIGSVTTLWTANASTQATDINSLRANITAANTAITTANTAMKSYVDAELSSVEISIGQEAGKTSQGSYSVAIGRWAGRTSQGGAAVAIGSSTGETSQGEQAIAIGEATGASNQRNFAVAIGSSAGRYTQGESAVAVGYRAGLTTQGVSSIAIGNRAGEGLATAQADQTVIINATGYALNGNPGQIDSFYVAPVRNDTGNVSTALFYNTTTKEITTANIMLAAFTMSNHQQWTSNVSTIGDALNQLAARLKDAGF